jgi:PAS domain S-box-containing protein
MVALRNNSVMNDLAKFLGASGVGWQIRRPQSYVYALLAVAVASFVRSSLPNVLHETPFLAFYPAVVIAAALGGFGPGLLATAASWFCVAYFFDTTPRVIGWTDLSELGRLLIFLAGGTGVSLISEAQMRGQARQMRQARDLKELTQLTNLGTFIIRDEQDRIVHWSDGSARLYGFTSEQTLGRTCYELLQTKFPQPLDQIKDILRREGRWEGELRHIRADGTIIIVFSQWVARDSAQEASPNPAVLEIDTDITRLKQTEDALRNASEELKRSNKDLEDFAYVASHDLQEPLRGINGFLALILKHYAERLDTKGREYIAYSMEAATRMSQLIIDLLEYSKVSRIAKQLSPVDASAALARALANLRSAIEEAGALVTYNDLPTVMGDAMQLSRLFQNLIGNGIKFRSPERPCRIHMSAQLKEDSWEFSVKDNGIGIDPQQHERIFIIFQRLHARNRYPGTGIGLAICRKIVEHHGGRIWVESQPGEGATFCFTLTPARSSDL